MQNVAVQSARGLNLPLSWLGLLVGGDIARPAVFILDRRGVVQWRDVTDNWRVRVRPETILEQLSVIP